MNIPQALRALDQKVSVKNGITDVDLLQHMSVASRLLHSEVKDLVAHLIINEGWSYGRVGRTLGISRQGAQKSYGDWVEMVRDGEWDGCEHGCHADQNGILECGTPDSHAEQLKRQYRYVVVSTEEN